MADAPCGIYRPDLEDVSREDHSSSLVEFPMTVFEWSRLRVPVSGGFYLRVFPYRVLREAASLAKQKIVATFPNLYTPQTPIRYFWLKRQDCPVYFYTSGQIEALSRGAGLDVRFHDCGPIWAIEFNKR